MGRGIQHFSRRGRRAGAVTQRPLQSCLVAPADTHRGIEREPSIVSREHVAGVIGIEQPTERCGIDTARVSCKATRKSCPHSAHLGRAKTSP